jgi:hypothetical protein
VGYENQPDDLVVGESAKYEWAGCPFRATTPSWASNVRLVAYERRVGPLMFKGRDRRRCYRPGGHAGNHYTADGRWIEVDRADAGRGAGDGERDRTTDPLPQP